MELREGSHKLWLPTENASREPLLIPLGGEMKMACGYLEKSGLDSKKNNLEDFLD